MGGHFGKADVSPRLVRLNSLTMAKPYDLRWDPAKASNMVSALFPGVATPWKANLRVLGVGAGAGHSLPHPLCFAGTALPQLRPAHVGSFRACASWVLCSLQWLAGGRFDRAKCSPVPTSHRRSAMNSKPSWQIH